MGSELILTDADLFPADLRSPRIVSATLTGTSGGDPGTIAVTDVPPRIVWSPPGAGPARGIVTFAYEAANCRGTAAGSTVTVFSR